MGFVRGQIFVAAGLLLCLGAAGAFAEEQAEPPPQRPGLRDRIRTSGPRPLRRQPIRSQTHTATDKALALLRPDQLVALLGHENWRQREQALNALRVRAAVAARGGPKRRAGDVLASLAIEGGESVKERPAHHDEVSSQCQHASNIQPRSNTAIRDHRRVGAHLRAYSRQYADDRRRSIQLAPAVVGNDQAIGTGFQVGGGFIGIQDPFYKQFARPFGADLFEEALRNMLGIPAPSIRKAHSGCVTICQSVLRSNRGGTERPLRMS